MRKRTSEACSFAFGLCLCVTRINKADNRNSRFEESRASNPTILLQLRCNRKMVSIQYRTKDFEILRDPLVTQIEIHRKSTLLC